MALRDTRNFTTRVNNETWSSISVNKSVHIGGDCAVDGNTARNVIFIADN